MRIRTSNETDKSSIPPGVNTAPCCLSLIGRVVHLRSQPDVCHLLSRWEQHGVVRGQRQSASLGKATHLCQSRAARCDSKPATPLLFVDPAAGRRAADRHLSTQADSDGNEQVGKERGSQH